MINANLHKPSSAVQREVLAFSFIPVIQGKLNEFMNMELPKYLKVGRSTRMSSPDVA